MKKEFMLSILILFLITLIGSVSALCQNSNGYYDDCWKVLGYYDTYDNYNYKSNYYSSNYAYGQMDSCRDSRGNTYSCYKQYRNNPNYNYDNEDNYQNYDNYYYTNNRRISINYRDVYGNYVTEIRPYYTRGYSYNNYDLVYNNPYYPDVLINYNNQMNNKNREVVVYIR